MYGASRSNGAGGNTGNLIERDSGPPDPEDDEEGDDPIDPQIRNPMNRMTVNRMTMSQETRRASDFSPCNEAAIRGPPHHLVRKAKIRKAKLIPRSPCPTRPTPTQFQRFAAARHQSAVFYKFKDQMPVTFHVGTAVDFA